MPTDPTAKHVQELTKTLAAQVNEATTWAEAYSAVIFYIEALDKEAHLLGDGDFAQILSNALRRRGKTSVEDGGQFVPGSSIMG